jgi:hypothetical protein
MHVAMGSVAVGAWQQECRKVIAAVLGGGNQDFATYDRQGDYK